MGPKVSHVPLGVPEVPNSTRIQSPTGRNPRCEVLAAAEVYKIMAAAEALATDLKPRGSMTAARWADYSPKSLKPLVGNVKIIQSETQACWVHEDLDGLGGYFYLFGGGPGWLIGILILAYWAPKTMKKKGFGHIKTRLCTIKNI